MHWTGIDHFLGNFQAMAVKGVLMDRLGRAIDGQFGDIELHQRTFLASSLLHFMPGAKKQPSEPNRVNAVAQA
jgi:hypothetical protein